HTYLGVSHEVARAGSGPPASPPHGTRRSRAPGRSCGEHSKHRGRESESPVGECLARVCFPALIKSGEALPCPLRPQAVAELVLRRPREAALAAPCSPHDLRRTGIGDLVDAGADSATVRASGGACRSGDHRATTAAASGPSGAPPTCCMCPTHP